MHSTSVTLQSSTRWFIITGPVV